MVVKLRNIRENTTITILMILIRVTSLENYQPDHITDTVKNNMHSRCLILK